MPGLNDIRKTWTDLRRYDSVQALKDGVRRDKAPFIARRGARSACWKIFLIFDTVNLDDWTRTLTSSRSAYDALRTHFLRAVDPAVDAVKGSDPLSHDAEWTAREKDAELRAEIVQDVLRCMPEMAYFREPATQRMLGDILFVYCKLNQDVSYRQGMHELLAPILWVVEHDALEIGDDSRILGEDATIKAFFDPEHVEHDAFMLFSQVMQGAKPFYLSEIQTSIASRSRHIFNDLLPRVDPELASHLETLQIVPQIYLLRWIRLLFGREFDFDSVLGLWDVIFAEDPTLEIVDNICIAMLLRIRWHLLEADYNTALGLLLKYPELDRDFPARTLALDALYLQTHLSIEGGSVLVHKYSGRPMRRIDRPSTPPALQRNITTFSGFGGGRSTHSSSPRLVNRSRNLESILQNTAKNLYSQTDKLGIGNLVRNAVDEVHKRAQEIREAQAASPARRRPAQSQIGERLKSLEERNRKLSALLSGTVTELWDFQKDLLEGNNSVAKSMSEGLADRLGTAIGKVQLVQVYLEEPTVLLPDDEEDNQKDVESEIEKQSLDSSNEPPITNAASTHANTTLPLPTSLTNQTSSPLTSHLTGLADPNSFEDFSLPSPTSTRTNPQPQPTQSDSLSARPRSRSPSNPRPRPPLEQSSFSFMLGQEQPQALSGMLSPTPERARAHASLFATHNSNTNPSSSSPAKKKTPGAKSKPRASGSGDLSSAYASSGHSASSVFGTEGVDDFDMSSLRRAGGSGAS